MNSFPKGWKKLLKESRNPIFEIAGDTTRLYHFCGALCWRTGTPDGVTLDPDNFLKKRKSYSRNEYERSQVPRIFFYLDPSSQESVVSGPLYSAEVPSSKIYDLQEDENKYIEEIKEKRQEEKYWAGDITWPLRKGEDWNKIYNRIKEDGYGGVYEKRDYGDIVMWFETIEVTLEKQEEE